MGGWSLISFSLKNIKINYGVVHFAILIEFRLIVQSNNKQSSSPALVLCGYKTSPPEQDIMQIKKKLVINSIWTKLQLITVFCGGFLAFQAAERPLVDNNNMTKGSVSAFLFLLSFLGWYKHRERFICS